MNRRLVTGAMLALLIGAIGAGAGYWYGGMRSRMTESDTQARASAPPGRKILYWHDPMVPQHKFDKPGKSPFMDMQLVPVYADDDGGAAGSEAPGVRIDAALAQNLGMRTAEVRRGTIARELSVTGNVAYDESQVVVVQARASGWIESLHVRSPGDAVVAGMALASIYSPDWLAAQEEYLALRRAQRDDLASAARARLVHLGVPEAQIQAIEADGKPRARVTLTSPRGGIAVELGARDAMTGAVAMFAREGMQVSPGMTLFRIASLAHVWVLAEVPEAQVASFAPGTGVEVRVAALPGRTFRGRVATLLPDVNPATRTLKARINLDNAGGAMKPGMFAEVRLAGNSQRTAALAPTEAVIATGRRKVAIVAEAASGAGARTRFSVREIETGAESGEVTEIMRGLAPGERVVVSGQFLIDSEASLKAFTTRLGAAGADSGPPAAADSAVHRADGRVEGVAGNAVTLSHGPVPSLKWPPMTMEFKAPGGGLPRGIAPGDRVTFSFRARADGEYEITSIVREAAAAAPRAAQGRK